MKVIKFFYILVMIKIGVMASGAGSNFKAIIDRMGDGSLEAECKFLLTNNKNCGAVVFAKTYGIPIYHISSKTHPNLEEYEKTFLDIIEHHNIDLLILAGYMKILPQCVIEKMNNRILNIHPSLLPKFGGKGFYGMFVHKAVIEAKEKESGATVHLVTSEIDKGKILIQKKVPVFDTDTEESLAERVHKVEHQIYWKAISDYAKSI